MLSLRPAAHSAEWSNRPDRPANVFGLPEIAVDAGDEPPVVVLVVDPLYAETLDDRSIERHLEPAEARALAAALYHFADAVDRRG